MASVIPRYLPKSNVWALGLLVPIGRVRIRGDLFVGDEAPLIYTPVFGGRREHGVLPTHRVKWLGSGMPHFFSPEDLGAPADAGSRTNRDSLPAERHCRAEPYEDQ
jgi:hypothetical protein